MNANAEPQSFRHEAMATWFDIRIGGEDATYARQAAQAAFAVIDRLDQQLSRYREDSEITQLRLLAPGASLRLSVDTFDCLQLAGEIATRTGGAFDPGLGSLMDRRRPEPAPGFIDEPAARGRLLLDQTTRTAIREGGVVSLDLGAIGKGFSLDRAADELRDWQVSRALLVSGGSSILALDAPDTASPGWLVRIGETRMLPLQNAALGSSGKGVKGEHIINPRTGEPVTDGLARSWALSESAAVADAYSTAFMVLSWTEVEGLCRDGTVLAAFGEQPTGAFLSTIPLQLATSEVHLASERAD